MAEKLQNYTEIGFSKTLLAAKKRYHAMWQAQERDAHWHV